MWWKATNSPWCAACPTTDTQLTIADLAADVRDIFADPDFDIQFGVYLDHLQNRPDDEPAPGAPGYFALKHRFITLADALHDACLAMAMLPDPKLSSGFYENEIRPLETACVKAFDDVDPEDALKKSLRDMIDDLRNFLGSKALEIKTQLETPHWR